ncbi:GH32 C-terminal domain-containing protein [Litchfieldia salsa]|uniref:beta-fructofuranosidase n=1 Tax=Litchfieldia salsa TaxID=930152 RepID=A0A1H0VYH3_9BACI|nr:GH32 C-terminal domain-containing protein [Litchfieldia salsa]SDP83460.1 Sucrose-6-phosphate hydrolase SacC, GH32 family [Litchfieldia salsa]
MIKQKIWIGLIVLAICLSTSFLMFTKTKQAEVTSTNNISNTQLALALSDQALHQWGFDEGNGNVTTDLSQLEGSNIHYTFKSDPEWKDGISGTSLLFDGYSNWLEIAPDKVQKTEESFAIEAWVAPRAYEWGDEGKASVIINQHDKEKNQGFVLGMGRHGYITFQLALNGEWYEIWSPKGQVLPKNQWSYVVAQFNKENHKLTLYLNGKIVEEIEVPENSLFTPADTQPLLVGKHNQAVAVSDIFQANMFNGLMDNVSLYNKVFSDETVKGHYKEVLNYFHNELPKPSTSFDRTVYKGDRYRPNYHFTAPQHWMNEPHAPIYYKGNYHLFYQFNPAGPFWHQIHWGHATSNDMIHWEDRPIALSPTEDTVARDGVWSGSATFDQNGIPVLFYTAGHDEMTPNQMTGIARPVDANDVHLNNWNMNPSPITIQQENIDTPKGKVMFGQFRDPYVWKDGDKWYQLVGSGVEESGGTALLYTSDDMEHWNYEKPFMIGDKVRFPRTGDVWELPFLVPIKNDQTGQQKYVFMISPYFMSSSPYASRFTFYWIGTWDSNTLEFIPDIEEPKMFDYGEHFTGAQGFADEKGRTIVTSLLQDRRSEIEKYESGWAHGAGLPLEIYLNHKQELGIRPIDEVQSLRSEELVSIENATMEEANIQLEKIQSDQVEIELELDVSSTKDAGLKILKERNYEEETFIFYKNETNTINIDRGRSSKNPTIEKGIQGGEIVLEDNNLKLHIFIDKSIVEAYVNNEISISSRVFPMLEQSKGLEVYGIDGEPFVRSLRVWSLETAIIKERD